MPRCDQHGGHRTAAAVQVRLDRHTLGFHVGVGPQIQRGVGGQQHRLLQRLDVGALLSGDVDEHGVAAEILCHQTVFGELRPDLGRVGALLVDLVHRHHDRHVGRLRVVDGLHRLRHDAVVGGDHQDRDVGGLRAAGTHGGERLVTRGVDEGDQPLFAVEVDGHLVSADVLGDAAGLGLADVGVPDGVQQSGLTVVDVTHHGHHRWTGLQVLLAAFVFAVGEVKGLQQLAVFVLGADDLDDVVHLAAEQFERLVADRLGRRHHLAEVEQRLHQRGRVGVDLLGEIAQRGAAGEPDGLAVAVRQPHATDDRRLHVLVLGAFRPLRLATAPRRTAGTAERTGSTTALSGTATAAASTWDGRGSHRRRHRRAGHRRRRRHRRRGSSTAATAAAGPATGRAAAWPGAGTGARPAGTRRSTLPTTGAAGTGRHAAGRCARARGAGTRGAPGRGAAGRGMAVRPAAADENGLLPTRGVRAAGLGAGRGPGTGPGRVGVGAGAAGRLRLLGSRGRRLAGGSGGAAGRRGCGGAGGFLRAEGPHGFDGGLWPAAGAVAGRSSRGAGLPPPNDSRSRRATGASTVDDADLTNSPCSLEPGENFLAGNTEFLR